LRLRRWFCVRSLIHSVDETHLHARHEPVPLALRHSIIATNIDLLFVDLDVEGGGLVTVEWL
jgi:hypothetical protein